MMSIKQAFKEGAVKGKARIANSFFASLRGERLTFGGELIVSRTGMGQIDRSEVANMGIMPKMQELNGIFPDVSLQVVDGLCDVTLKFFLYDTPVAGRGFYQKMQDVFRQCAILVYEADRYSLRLNVIGEYQSLGQIEAFRFLNKRDVISYKVLTGKAGFCPLKSLRSRLAAKWDSKTKI